MRARALICATCVAAGLGVAHGQEPSFEVASVKVNTSGGAISRMAAPAGTGRFEVTNAPVRMLILNAYGIPGFQLAGGPSWIDTVRVDVSARAATSATRDEISRMVRGLLAERFHLAVHREQRRCRCTHSSSRVTTDGWGQGCRHRPPTAPPPRPPAPRRRNCRPGNCCAQRGCRPPRSTPAA